MGFEVITLWKLVFGKSGCYNPDEACLVTTVCGDPGERIDIMMSSPFHNLRSLGWSLMSFMTVWKSFFTVIQWTLCLGFVPSLNLVRFGMEDIQIDQTNSKFVFFS